MIKNEIEKYIKLCKIENIIYKKKYRGSRVQIKDTSLLIPKIKGQKCEMRYTSFPPSYKYISHPVRLSNPNSEEKNKVIKQV